MLAEFPPTFFRDNNIEQIQLIIDPLHCNAKCEFCYLPPVLARLGGNMMMPLHRDADAMPVIRDFIVGFAKSREALNLPVFPVEVIGGELAMYPHNLEMLKEWHAAAPNLNFRFITNGIVFGKSWIDFAVATNSEVHFSLNAYDEASHRERMQVGPVFPTVVANIRACADAIRGRTYLSTVVSPKTIREHYYSKVSEFIHREFHEKGYNLQMYWGPNMNTQDFSHEETWLSYEYDPELLREFLEHELPVLFEHNTITDINLFQILNCLKADPQTLDATMKLFYDSQPEGRRWVPPEEETLNPNYLDIMKEAMIADSLL